MKTEKTDNSPPSAEDSALLSMQLDTNTVGYAIGEIKSNVSGLTTTVDEIKQEIKGIDEDVRGLWKSAVGAGLSICLAGLGAAVFVYTQLSDQITTLRTETNAKMEKLDTDVEALQEQLTEFRISSSEDLGDVQRTLTDITLKIDGLSSAESDVNNFAVGEKQEEVSEAGIEWGTQRAQLAGGAGTKPAIMEQEEMSLMDMRAQLKQLKLIAEDASAATEGTITSEELMAKRNSVREALKRLETSLKALNYRLGAMKTN